MFFARVRLKVFWNFPSSSVVQKAESQVYGDLVSEKQPLQINVHNNATIQSLIKASYGRPCTDRKPKQMDLVIRSLQGESKEPLGTMGLSRILLGWKPEIDSKTVQKLHKAASVRREH